ncbi:hypothetical protein AABM38_11805 [Heyndrickxia sp. MSNUG]|uniref:hypothetical protein n=1 Tax=Heyndrickxia sp. MSNUG TaxID=3136677 RepID=UPI003C2B8061
MFAVHFFENKNQLLTQLLKTIPTEGQDLKIKGRKAKVTSVTTVDEKNIHVQVALEAIVKTKQPLDLANKKKR